jgi:hypothetical protein
MEGSYTRWRTEFQRAERRGYTPIAYILVRLLGSLPDLALRAIVRSVGPTGRALTRVGGEVELTLLRRQLLRPHRLGGKLDRAIQRFDELQIDRRGNAA